MNEPMKRVIAIAIESYMHAPRVLSVSKVVRQLAAVFPDQDRETLAQQVQKSRRIIAVNARGNTRTCEAHRLPEWPLPLPSNNGVEARRGGDDWQEYWPSHYQSCVRLEPESRD